MRPRAMAAFLTLVAASALLAGCIQGAFRAADVPSGALAAGWFLNQDASQGGEKGLPPIVVAKYQVNAYARSGTPPGALYVISVSDVPVFDEQAEIQRQLDPAIREQGIELREVRRGQGAVGPDAATWILYDASQPGPGVTLQGKAIDVGYTCGANAEAVRVFGFAVTQVSGILGSEPDESTWRQVAGDDPAAGLGGMVGQVACS